MLTNIDHVALAVDDPIEAARWYASNFHVNILYQDETWSFVQLENIKIAFVKKGTHPPHIAIKVYEFDIKDKTKNHRDGTISTYKRDPWGNIYELIKYPETD
jgi:hypothetical protein